MPNKFVDAAGVTKIHRLVQEDIDTAVATKQDVIDDLQEIRENAADVVNKQDTINDLETIRSGAAEGATAVQPEDIVWASEMDIHKLFHLIPNKGDIISFDAFGDGTQKRFRVIKIEDNIATLMSLDNSVSSKYNNTDTRVQFDDGNSYQQYTDGVLDLMMNNTYYNSLSQKTQAAIIATDKIQSCYSLTAGQDSLADFNILSSNGTTYAYNRVTQKAIGTRVCSALDMDDIKEYFNLSIGDIINYQQLLETFFEQTATLDKYIWTRSASNDGPSAFCIFGYFGILGTNDATNNNIIYPTFKINLFKIDFTIEGGNN